MSHRVLEGRLRVSIYKVEFPFESLLVYFILRNETDRIWSII